MSDNAQCGLEFPKYQGCCGWLDSIEWVHIMSFGWFQWKQSFSLIKIRAKLELISHLQMINFILYATFHFWYFHRNQTHVGSRINNTPFDAESASNGVTLIKLGSYSASKSIVLWLCFKAEQSWNLKYCLQSSIDSALR